MPWNASSRWPQVPCRNDHSGTIRGGNCDRNTGNAQHYSTRLLQYYNESDKCQPQTSAGIYWTLRSFKVQEWRNGGWVSQIWVVCDLLLCHVPGEEDGIIRDTTVHRRGGSFAGNSSSLEIPTILITIRLQQPLQNLFQGTVHRCFKHVLPWTMGRRETYLRLQAVTAKLLLLLNISLSCRTCGFLGTGSNFFTIAPNSSTIPRGKWCSDPTQEEISTSLWATERLLVMSVLDRIWQPCATRREPTHGSAFTSSMLCTYIRMYIRKCIWYIHTYAHTDDCQCFSRWD